jgi:hypothetical protein
LCQQWFPILKVVQFAMSPQIQHHQSRNDKHSQWPQWCRGKLELNNMTYESNKQEW